MWSRLCGAVLNVSSLPILSQVFAAVVRLSWNRGAEFRV
jgi:hypothetical protein